jgi:hypothetical protein
LLKYVPSTKSMQMDEESEYKLIYSDTIIL